MSTPVHSERRGIACSGAWIVDHVKLIDAWPNPGNLASILDEQMGTGGCAFNVFIDLMHLKSDLPLEAIGLVGDDEDGRWILDQVAPVARNKGGLGICRKAPTSYTDVMTVRSSGRRTFFHMRGANAHFDVEHAEPAGLGSKIYVLGYLLLLDRLDAADEEYGTRAARLLASVREEGLLTAIDLVSAEEGRFREVVVPALAHTDYCIVNEIEAGAVTDLKLRGAGDKPDWPAAEAAARRLAELGVARNVTIHLPEGALSFDVAADSVYQVPSLTLRDGFIKGAAGAGDAFCAGLLLGLHEAWPIERSLELAHAAAAASLRHPTCTEGLASVEEVLKLARSLAAS